jgi:hypothetical protein
MKGYFSFEEVCALQCEGTPTNMGDPVASEATRGQTAPGSRRGAEQSDKAFVRKRDEHLEKSVAHVLDQGGMRRATLRGTENLTKLLTAAALAYNLSLLMRKLFRLGTPKQWAAKACFLVFWLMKPIPGATRGFASAIIACFARMVGECRSPRDIYRVISANGPLRSFSTGC